MSTFSTLVGEGSFDASLKKIVNDNFTALQANSALFLGSGSTSAPLSTATADKNFIGVWTKSTATSGDSRGSYLRHYLAGAGGSGEALRAFGTVLDVAAAGAHGAHISLSFGSSGSITGLGVANRNTLQLPNAVMAGGTYAATQAEIWADGSTTSAAGVTEMSLIRCVLGGDATGVGTVEHKAAFASLAGNTIASGHILQAKSAAAVTHALRILVNGVAYYIMVSDTL